VNLATLLANRGKKTCLLDLDLSAPGFHAIFKNVKTKYGLNDYVSKTCEIEVLKEYNSACTTAGRSFVHLAIPRLMPYGKCHPEIEDESFGETAFPQGYFAWRVKF
jgi:hypothetical protein